MFVPYSFGNLEGDGVVVKVEVSWVLSHENVSKDEVVEALWELHGLDSEQALALSCKSDLESILFWGQSVSGSINGESHVWKVAES